MSNLKFICPVCYNKAKGFHSKCSEKYSSYDEYKYEFCKLNYPVLKLESKDYLENLYINMEYSYPDFKKQFKIDSKRVTFLLDWFNISKRNIKVACNLKSYKEKYVKTCMHKYGTPNSLSKNTEAYHKRNNTIKRRYGVDNVFQLEHVKEKANNTMMLLYGKLRITNAEKISEIRKAFTDEMWEIIYDKFISTINNRTEKRQQEIVNKKSELSKNWWKSLSDDDFEQYMNKLLKCNKLETRISKSLSDIGLTFTYSKFVNRRQYDFKIGDILLEVNGDFWHANPKIYKESDILNFPKNKKITAKELWEKDSIKKQNGEKYGYTVLYIWESEIKKLSDSELDEYLIQLLLNRTISSTNNSSALL